MEALFIQIVKLSISASLLALAAVVLRPLFRRAPKWIPCALWALVGLRLVLPITVHSRVSVVPDPVVITTQVRAYTAAVREEAAALPVASPAVSVTRVLAWVWLAGVCAMLVYFLASSAALHRRVRGSSIRSEGVRVSEWAQTPFVLGVLRPVIILPTGLAEEDLPYILAHERAHIRRGDQIWKPLGFVLLSVYWFDPVLWLAYILLCRDIEAACDERVIREMSAEGRRAYSCALLNCAVHRRVISACPIAFGEVGVKARIKSVMNYRRPAFWIILLAVLASVIAAVCLLTTKKAPETPNAERPMLYMDGKYYVDPYMPESTLPAGYTLAGELTAEQTNNTGLEGTEYYVNPESFDFYTYQLCGTPVSLDTVDSENRQMAYLRWIPADFDAIAERRLSMDAVLMLAQKGSELTWTDFDRYACEPTGYHFEALGDTPAVLRTYPIDKNYEVVIGGSSTDKVPEYIILRNRDVNAWVDLRTQNAADFVEAYQPAEKQPMTRDDVKHLAKYGQNLTWEQFEPYQASEVTDERRVYVIDNEYTLYVIGNEKPTSVLLSDGSYTTDILKLKNIGYFVSFEHPTLKKDKSWFRDFEIVGDVVNLYCRVCIDNPSNAELLVQLVGDFREDEGLVTQTLLTACHWDFQTTAYFFLEPGENSFDVVFSAPYGGIPVKHDRLLPPITILSADALDEAVIAEMNGELLFVNGTLYKNTGRESTMDARCGTMDGAVESAVEAGQVPTEERQSNFGTGYEFQYVTNEEIDVVIDGKWMVFRAPEPLPRKYICKTAAPETDPPYLDLTNGWFEFCVSPQNDKTYWGWYTLESGILTLNAVEGETFVFDRTDDGFRFRADSSTPLPTYPYSEGTAPRPPFGDGAVFTP